MNPKLVLFDLDGTLIDSRHGIEHSLRLTLSAFDVTLDSREDLRWCIGAPLYSIFGHFLQTSNRSRIDGAVSLYRHIYRDGPMFEFTVYDGVMQSLTYLHHQGVRLAVATAKVHEYAREVINTAPFAGLMSHVYGSELDGTNVEKRDLIRHILHTEAVAPDEVLMVGDRHHDIDGACANGVAAIAAAYGYGDAHEFTRASAIIDHAGALVHAIGNLQPLSR